MNFQELRIAGVWLIEPALFEDERGVFRRHFCAEEFKAHGLEATVMQGNISENPYRGTLRGFHYQLAPSQEAKTLSCLTGAVFDVVADLRPGSPTFMKWVSVEFGARDRRSLHVPAGCANAWLTTEDNTVMHYYMSAMYAPNSYRGFRYDDPGFGFNWPFTPKLISDKDHELPYFDPKAQ